jgi:N-acetylglutamate synthase-like GNAT family acetyltransferase
MLLPADYLPSLLDKKRKLQGFLSRIKFSLSLLVYHLFMLYREIQKSDGEDILDLSITELGWTPSRTSLQESIDNYPGAVARQGELCGFVHSEPLSSDILRVSNLLVSSHHRKEGIGERLLLMLEARAKYSGYEAIIFPEDPNWFPAGDWMETHGYRSIFDTDASRIVVKDLD